MIRYGKSTQHAIAAMSRLAEVYEQGQRISSADIAKTRDLSQTLVAKLLTHLSTAELVVGAPGPHGGYALARPPADITLYDVVSVFERTDGQMTCPFGPHWCGRHEPCPLHNQLVQMDEQFQQFLKTTTLAVFSPGHPAAEHAQPDPTLAPLPPLS